MITVFGTEEWRPIVRHGIIIPDYFVNKRGQIYSAKSGKILKPSLKYDNQKLRNRIKCLKVELEIPEDLFPDYTYRKKRKNSKSCTLSLDVHRAVMETWNPVNECPPETLAETWNQIITPDMVGQPRITDEWKVIVGDSLSIDHIDDDPTNNHIDNLRRTTPKENSSHRKKYEISKNSTKVSRGKISGNKISTSEISKGNNRVSGTLSGWW